MTRPHGPLANMWTNMYTFVIYCRLPLLFVSAFHHICSKLSCHNTSWRYLGQTLAILRLPDDSLLLLLRATRQTKRGTNQLRSFRGLRGSWPQKKNNISSSFPVVFYFLWLQDSLQEIGKSSAIEKITRMKLLEPVHLQHFPCQSNVPNTLMSCSQNAFWNRSQKKTILQLSIFDAAWPAQLFHQSAGVMNAEKCQTNLSLGHGPWSAVWFQQFYWAERCKPIFRIA